MARNHSRVNQTSTTLLQGWRGNCDLQILIYDSHPDQFDLREISKVTDYVVAYSCKANTTFHEEVEMNKRIIMGMQETTGDSSELKSLCRHLTNKASSARLISKQEASVLLGDLELTVCSEMIDSVSISNSLRLTVSGVTNQKHNLLWQYMKRPIEYDSFSLHQYYPVFRTTIMGKGSYVPHYVGVSGNPTFPVSKGYARHVLIVYKPWRTYPNQQGWLSDFNKFIHSPLCPESAKLTFNRVLQRYYDGTKFVEPTAKSSPCNDNNLSQEDLETLILAGLGGAREETDGSLDLQSLERGLDFQWDKEPRVRFCYLANVIGTWYLKT